MRQALRLPLPSSKTSSIVRNTAARPHTSPLASVSALKHTSNTNVSNTSTTTTTPARSFSTTGNNMSFLRPSSFFNSPFDDFDVFPSSMRDFMMMNPFTAAAASRPNVTAGDYRIWSGPKVDLHEEDTKFVLTAELPGVKKEDVKINVDADRRRLTLEGHMKNEYSSQPASETPTDKENVNKDKKDAGAASTSTEVSKEETGGQVGPVGHALVSERVYGSFSRSFTLPPIANLADDSSLKARFNDGLLRLEIPKKKEEHSKTRQIAIETA